MKWVVFSNVYVALCGAALTAASPALWGDTPRIDAVVGVVFFGTLVIYNLDRLAEPHPGDSEHEKWVQRHALPLWALTIASAASALACALQLNKPAAWSLVASAIVAIGYCIPFIGPRFTPTRRWLRLKDLPGAKLPLIAAVWAYATCVLPMLQAGAGFDLGTGVVILARFLFLAAVALPFDLPDMLRDKQSGIATLPTHLGFRATKATALSLATAALLLSLLGPFPAAWAVMVSCVGAVALVVALRPDRGILYFMVLLDGMLLVQAGALWITTS